jgi:hypothetical protein
LRRVVLPRDAFPTRIPIWATLVLGLLLDRIGAPGWVWGVAGSVMLLLIGGAIYLVSIEDAKKLPGYGNVKEDS